MFKFGLFGASDKDNEAIGNMIESAKYVDTDSNAECEKDVAPLSYKIKDFLYYKCSIYTTSLPRTILELIGRYLDWISSLDDTYCDNCKMIKGSYSEPCRKHRFYHSISKWCGGKGGILWKFPNTCHNNKDDAEKIHKALSLLREVGWRWDTGSGGCGQDNEMDWSLRGTYVICKRCGYDSSKVVKRFAKHRVYKAKYMLDNNLCRDDDNVVYWQDVLARETRSAKDGY